ncbi:MAG TPA: hypothetical protein VMM18_00125 [Gemmatimonadaceae bacterium]|nr:hypothetical protein [Gemmatimonadaceae bacterium]
MRHQPSFRSLAAAILALAGCTTGPHVGSYAPAQSPAGVEIRVRLRGGEIRGELLEVRDSGIVVLPVDDVVLIPFDSIRGFRLAQESTAYAGGTPSRATHERLRLLSRFPAGIAPEHLARLLESRRQQSLRIHEPQADSAAEAAFIAKALAGTARFQDVAVAEEAGYRRLGGDLPSLGQHWVHGGRVLADTLDPASPSILVYVSVAGRPVLAGVAYTRLLAPGASPPAFPRSQPNAWHEHNGAVENEVLPTAHHAAHGAGGSDARLRIAVMHAWIWIANPAGVWESDNWGLPHVRLGLEPRAGPPGLDARALSLAASAQYYLRAIAGVGALTTDELTRVEIVLAEHATRAADEAARVLARPAIENEPARVGDDPALAGIWDSLWTSITDVVRPEAAARLAPLRAALAGEVH